MENERRTANAAQLWLVILVVTSLVRDVGTLASTRCSGSEMEGMKTWGPQCELLCRCRHNEPCDPFGLCVNGCLPGWGRAIDRRCSMRTVNDGHRKPFEAYADSLSNLKESHNLPQSRGPATENSSMYHSLTRETCISDSIGSLAKTWQLTAYPPVLVKVLKVTFNVLPRRNDHVRCVFTAEGFPEYLVTRGTTQSPSEPAVQICLLSTAPIIATSLTIAVTSGAGTNCSPATIRSFYLYALPVCPYRKWGSQCTQDCPCPCEVSQCHPTSGTCDVTGFNCPPGMFGPDCGHNCSAACPGELFRCHALSGICEECQEANQTDVDCGPAQAQVPRPCDRFPSTKTLAVQGQLEPALSDHVSKPMFTMISVTLGMMVVVTCSCCCYVQIVRRCAKERFKDLEASLDGERRRRVSVVPCTAISKEIAEVHGT